MVVASSELAELGRGSELQARYDKWMTGIKDRYGTTGEYALFALCRGSTKTLTSCAENYLIEARLPWKSASTNGHVDPSVKPNEAILPNGVNDDERYLKFDIGQELDPDLYAVLPNDWPYNTPYDVEHVVVWSKVSIRIPQCPPRGVVDPRSLARHLPSITHQLRWNQMGSDPARWIRGIYGGPGDAAAARQAAARQVVQQLDGGRTVGMVHGGGKGRREDGDDVVARGGIRVCLGKSLEVRHNVGLIMSSWFRTRSQFVNPPVCLGHRIETVRS